MFSIANQGTTQPSAVDTTAELEPQDSERLLKSFMPDGALPADVQASRDPVSIDYWSRGTAAQAIGTRPLDLPSIDEMEDKFCWNWTNGIPTGNARRLSDGGPPCPDFNGSHQKVIQMNVWRDEDLIQHLAFEADRIQKEGRVALTYEPTRDSQDFAEAPWCDSEEDLVRQAIALLREPSILDAIDLLICMFVTVRSSDGSTPVTEEVQAARHCEVGKRVRELLGLDVSEVGAVSGCAPAIGGGAVAVNSVTGTDLPALEIKKSHSDVQPNSGDAMIGAFLDPDVAAKAYPSRTPPLLTLVSDPSFILRTSEVVFSGLGTEPGSPRSKLCSIVAMARLIFHELLHLACVIAVPEVREAEPCGPLAGHRKKEVETECDVVYLIGTAFSYVLDQLFESQPPAYQGLEECQFMATAKEDVGYMLRTEKRNSPVFLEEDDPKVPEFLDFLAKKERALHRVYPNSDWNSACGWKQNDWVNSPQHLPDGVDALPPRDLDDLPPPDTPPEPRTPTLGDIDSDRWPP